MIPAHAIKLVFAGTLQGGEVFAHSLWVDFGSQPSQSDLNTFVTNCYLTFNAQVGITGVKSSLPNTTAYATVTGYAYDGAHSNAVLVSPPTAITCTGTAGTGLPNQCALVMSLLTGIPGRSFRGRTYLPACQSSSLAATGQVGSSTVDTFANAWAGFINGMEAGGGGSPAVKFVVASAAKGVLTEVVNVQIDSRLDVQRRRAFKQLVTYKKTVSV